MPKIIGFCDACDDPRNIMDILQCLDTTKLGWADILRAELPDGWDSELVGMMYNEDNAFTLLLKSRMGIFSHVVETDKIGEVTLCPDFEAKISSAIVSAYRKFIFRPWHKEGYTPITAAIIDNRVKVVYRTNEAPFDLSLGWSDYNELKGRIRGLDL